MSEAEQVRGGAVDPIDWFRDLGYRLTVGEDANGVWWADLKAIANPAFVVARYGRGDTAGEAAERARARWQVEQIGAESAPEEPRKLP